MGRFCFIEIHYFSVMKIVVYIILILSLSVSSCKRKRKVNVEGNVTDVYTGKPVQNVDVYLYSQITYESSGGGQVNSYQQTTDANGYFSFTKAVFSKPANQGWLNIQDDEYQDIDVTTAAHGIKEDHIKFIGKTTLMRNIQVICISKLRLTLNISSSLDVQHAIFYRKFLGTGNVPEKYAEFYEFGWWPERQPLGLPNQLVGYTDGKNIIKTDYFDQNSQTLKTQYDTIISQGCGSINNYTITLN